MVTARDPRDAARDSAPLSASTERRETTRNRSCYRMVKLVRDCGASLCQLGNISDEGMMLTCQDPPSIGEALIIELSDDHSLTGQVAWADDGHCGVQFDRAIDSAALLRNLATEQRNGVYRPPRIMAQLLGVAYSEMGMHPIRTTNLSQRGMGINHDGRMRPDLHLLVMLENGVERRGVVRWSHDHRAGIMLTEPLGCAEINRCVDSERGYDADPATLSRS